MILNRRIFSISRAKYTILYIILSLNGCLLSVACFAQNQLTYGVHVGVGSTELYNGSSHASAAAAPVGSYYAQMNSEAQGSSSVAQLGGYVRYYFARAIFVQSGIDYSNTGGNVNFSTESFLPEDEPNGAIWRPGYNVDYFSVRQRYHQLEVPLLLGVRIAKQLRFYVGPTVGVSLHTSTQVNTTNDYTVANDPVFRNLRVGLGADMQRLSLDIHLQESFPATNDSSFKVSKPLPGYFFGDNVSAGYDNVALRSVVVTVGYRLY